MIRILRTHPAPEILRTSGKNKRRGHSRCIGFRAEVTLGVDSGGRGEATISALDLNRPDLVERRRERYETYKCLFQIVRLASDEPGNTALASKARDAERLLLQAAVDDAEYAAMIRVAISHDFDPTT